MDLEQLTQRVISSEREIAKLTEDVARLQRAVRRTRRRSALASAGVLLVAAGTLANLSSARMQAQAAAQPLTVKAPFTVVDSANQPILTVNSGKDLRGIALFGANRQSVLEAGTGQEGEATVVIRGKDGRHGAFLRMKLDEPELELRGSDSHSFVHLQRSGAALRAPLTVNDLDDHAIAVVQDLEATIGAGKPAALPRGIHVLNGKGVVVARTAVDKEGNGFVIARDAMGKGGAVAMLTGGAGGQLTVAGEDGLVRIHLDKLRKNRVARFVGPFTITRGLQALAPGGQGLRCLLGGGLDPMNRAAVPFRRVRRLDRVSGLP